MPEIGDPEAVTGMGPIRSHHCRQSSFVTFCNCTGRSVRPVWINYRGQPETYAEMKAQSGRKMNTFMGERPPLGPSPPGPCHPSATAPFPSHQFLALRGGMGSGFWGWANVCFGQQEGSGMDMRPLRSGVDLGHQVGLGKSGVNRWV